MKIIAIIPAYNEEQCIEEVIAKTLKYVDEVLVIDDGSADNTSEVARQAGALVVRNVKNLGLGLTIRRGYLETLESDADIVVQLDADGQYDPEEIPVILKPILDDEADMVLGSRLENLMYKMPAMKRFGNKAFSKVLRILTDEDVKDGQTGFRAIRKEVLETAIPNSKFSYTQEMIIRVAMEGWRIRSVPIHFFARKDGESRLFGSSISFAFKGWAIILRTLRDYYPLRFFGFPGLVLTIIGFLICLYVLILFLTTGNVSPRMPTLILGVLILLSGMQLFFTGMIADMIKTHSSNNRHCKRPPRRY
jgi:glycosyltransferase involved in cell wall biosynthesis